jgi:hypothetical protein
MKNRSDFAMVAVPLAATRAAQVEANFAASKAKLSAAVLYD